MSHNRFQKQRILIIFLAFQFLMLGGSVFAAPSVGQLQQQNNSTETTLTVPDTMLLGSSVAIEGNTLVAGAPLENNGEGAAYVFVRGADGAWNQATTLTAPNAQKEDSFGSSVAIAGDTIVVGAPEVDKDQNTFDSGAAYVFVRGVGSTWSSSPTTTLTAPNGAANDKFGSSVAIAGDTLVVGAPEVDKDQNTFNSGAAYVFVRGVGSTWSSSPTTTLTASNGAANDKFGSSVAIAGDTLVVGAPSANNFAGAAYVFKRDAGQWNQTPTQLAVPTYGGLGSSVAIAGNTLVVGAPSANNFAGVAYIFSQSGGQWNQTPTQQLTAPNAQETDFFGRSVAIAGDTLVVGAPSANNFAGAAYVFKRDAGQWDLQASLKASNTTQGDYFGSSVAVTGDIYVAGAPGRNQGEGAVYVFKGLPSPGFSINDMQLYVSEGIGTVTFIVTRNGLIANAVSVDVATADGTAEAGKDYTALATTLNFATNETTQTVKVTINPDTTVESDETFFVELSNPSAGAVIHDGRKKMTIIDDDSPTSVLSPTPPPTPVPVKPLTFTATSSGTPLMIPNTQKLGNSVTLSGNTLVVGAPWENSGAGTAYVFVRGADGTWSQSAQLIAPVGGSFGWSVAIIAADSVVVGSPWENGGEGAAYVFVRGADGTWSSPTQLAAPNAQETDYFGSSVAAIAADTVVVGASGKNNNAGAAYVFVRGADGTWSQPPTQLAAPNAQKEDYFGSSVAAIAADTVVVGASGKNNNAGAAYVFVRGADGTWSQPPTPLTAPNPQEKDYFGSSVATAGNTLLVGAPGERNISMGSAHVFVRDADGTWSQSAKVEPLVVGGSFGSSVAISNDTLVVGAPAENNGAGAAYVFKRPLISGFSINDVLVNENDGTATFTVTRSGLITNAVSVDVATADGTAEAGEDYIALTTTLNFAANETTQTVEVTINPDTTVEPDKTFFVKLSNPSAGAVIHDGEGLGTIMNDDIAPSPTPTPAPPVTAVTTTAGTSFKAPNIQRLGSSVAIEGNILVVGAPWGNSGAGTAHVFVRGADGTWSSPTQLAASAGGSFGSSVTIEGNILVGGAPWENNGEGAAYVFVRGADGTWSSPTQLAAPAGGSFGSSVAIEGNILVVGAPLENNGEGAAYVFVRGADGTWSSPTQLAAPPPGGSFGSSVTLSGNTLVVGAPWENNGAGAAYVFARGADGTWISPTQLAAPAGGSFGSSVTLSGNTLVVGAPAENNDAGAAYVFKRPLISGFSINDVLVNENDGTATFTVTRSGLITNAVSVDVATADGTAEAGEDYTALTTTLNFAINETTQTVEVRINPDTTVEPDETFFVKLSNPSAGAVIHDEEGLGTIMNDDIVPSPTPVKPTPMTPTSTPVGDAPPCSTVPSVLPRDDGKPHAPQNMCVSLRQGQPRIVWSHDPNAQWFNFFIVDPNGNWQVNNQWFSIEGALLTNSELSLIDCDPGKVCTLDLPKTLPLIGPGRYELWMRAWGVPGGKGSFESGAWGTGGQTYDQFNLVVFDIPTTRPKHPTNMTVANANGEGPSVGWQAADGVIWYQLWIGRQLDKTTYVNHHFMSWAFAGDLGCSERGSRCEVKLPMPLSDGSNRLPAGTYQVWVNSWGPAGFAENDDPKLQGWRKIIELSVKE